MRRREGRGQLCSPCSITQRYMSCGLSPMVCDPTSDIILRKKQSRPSKYPICFSNLSLSLLHACGCLPPCSAGPDCSRPPVRAGHRIDRSGGRTGPSADSTRPLESPADPASRGSWTRSPSPQGRSTACVGQREGRGVSTGGQGKKRREGQEEQTRRAYRASPTLISSFCTKLSTNFHTFWSSFSAHPHPRSRV